MGSWKVVYNEGRELKHFERWENAVRLARLWKDSFIVDCQARVRLELSR